MRQQSLAEEGEDENEAREEVEREASKAAAQKSEGTVHLDDQYAQVENAPGPLYPPTHKGQDLDVIQFGDYPSDYGPHTAVRLRSQDTMVPVKMVQMSTYPIIDMQDEEGVSEHEHGDPGKPITANVLFGAPLCCIQIFCRLYVVLALLATSHFKVCCCSCMQCEPVIFISITAGVCSMCARVDGVCHCWCVQYVCTCGCVHMYGDGFSCSFLLLARYNALLAASYGLHNISVS